MASAAEMLVVLTPDTIQKLCFHCKKVDSSAKTCAACGIARYCSKECQVEARGDHVSNCKKIKKLRARMDREETQLRDEWANQGSDFDRWVGNFWSSFVARDYCRAKQQLAIALIEIAETSKNDYTTDPEGYLALLEAEKQYLELLRLSHSDNQGVRDDYVFVLLALERVQDCYDLIHWYLTLDNMNHDWGTPPRRFQHGEWMYPRGQDMMDDIFADPRATEQQEYISAWNLLALIVIKIQIIDELKSGKRKVNDSSVAAVAVQACIKKQEDLLLRYVKLMQKRNKWVLEGVINPEPLLAPGMPHEFSESSPEEAILLVYNARKVCDKKFGVRAKVQEVLESL